MASMTNCVRFEGLLFSGDGQVPSVMDQILDSFAIDTDVCADLDMALDAVMHRRLDTVIIDWSGPENPTRLIGAARKSSPNCNSTIVAMVNGNSEMQAALLAGATFIIHKPTDLDHVRRCMRAAYGTMLQQRRRSVRCTVDIPVIANIVEMGPLEARIRDLSIGGLALHCKRSLDIHQTVILSFLLPATTDIVHVTGRVVNADGAGRMGVCFSYVPEEEFDLLVNWLAKELTKLESVDFPVSDLAEN
jgi:PilZ domain